MIRFACPGCNATYTVEDSKGGKAGKCPKCAAQFVIPAADAAAVPPPAPEPRRSPPPPPPAPASDAAVEIKPCPKCGARLSVAATDLGVDVECPYCQAVYTAKRADAPDRPSRRREAPPPAEDRPSRRSRRDDDDEDRPSRRRAVADEDDDRPSRRRDEDEEAEDDDRPRKKKRRRSYQPHRGVMILIFGIIGFFCCIFAIVAATMGTNDLRAMDEGTMDPDGRGLTRAGQVFGIVSLGLNVLGIILNVGLALAK